MGQSAAETVTEIEQTRQRLSDELDELEERLPEAAVAAKKVAKMAAGSGVAGTLLMFVVKRARKKRKAKAEVAVVQPMAVRLQVPDRWGELLGDPRAKQWAMGVGGVWMLLRLAELRSLRKLRRQALHG